VFQKAEGDVDKNRSVWGSITPGDIKKVYGRAFHPFAEGKQFGSSKPCRSARAWPSVVMASTIGGAQLEAEC